MLEPHEALSAKLSLGQFVKRYLETHGNGSFESTSLKTAQVQLGHFERILGEAFPVQSLTLADLQRHVETRAKQKYRGRRLSPATIKKEVAALRAARNWAERMGMVKGLSRDMTFDREIPTLGLIAPVQKISIGDSSRSSS